MTFGQGLFSGFLFAIAMALSPTISNAQLPSSEALPRLALPVTPDDYPAASYFADEEGHVVLVATIGVDGRLSNVRVESSSGYANLDGAAIALANDARVRHGQQRRRKRVLSE